jgi:hypothetical protein
MAVTITAAQQKMPASDWMPHFNTKSEIVKLSGTIANTDTGTYTPKGIPLLDSGGVPMIIGVPHGISWAISNGVITFTCNIAAGFTNLAVFVTILCRKEGVQ